LKKCKKKLPGYYACSTALARSLRILAEVLVIDSVKSTVFVALPSDLGAAKLIISVLTLTLSALSKPFGEAN
jgi:hypothetical protein